MQCQLWSCRQTSVPWIWSKQLHLYSVMMPDWVKEKAQKYVLTITLETKPLYAVITLLFLDSAHNSVTLLVYVTDCFHLYYFVHLFDVCGMCYQREGVLAFSLWVWLFFRTNLMTRKGFVSNVMVKTYFWAFSLTQSGIITEYKCSCLDTECALNRKDLIFVCCVYALMWNCIMHANSECFIAISP